jgi:YgiT-type zinc finger domain-containing protein
MDNNRIKDNDDPCDFCGGQLHPQTLKRVDYPRGDETYRFENVPAYVCDSCGEIYFDAVVSQAMNRAVSSNPQPKRFDQVPVLELSLGAENDVKPSDFIVKDSSVKGGIVTRDMAYE